MVTLLIMVLMLTFAECQHFYLFIYFWKSAKTPPHYTQPLAVYPLWAFTDGQKCRVYSSMLCHHRPIVFFPPSTCMTNAQNSDKQQPIRVKQELQWSSWRLVGALGGPRDGGKANQTLARAQTLLKRFWLFIFPLHVKFGTLSQIKAESHGF